MTLNNGLHCQFHVLEAEEIIPYFFRYLADVLIINSGMDGGMALDFTVEQIVFILSILLIVGMLTASFPHVLEYRRWSDLF